MSADHTNLAAEFDVLSMLYRRGADASLTLGNKKAVDIVVALPPGQTASIDVKSVVGPHDWPCDNLRLSALSHHFIVIVSFEGKLADPCTIPSVWVVPAKAIETTRIHSVAGLTCARTALVTTRPCRAPHHTISDAGLIGGGHVPMSGEMSRAHHGVLFPDELPECRRHVLEVLRQPIEEGLTRIQSPARPKSQCCCGFSSQTRDLKLLRPSRIAACHYRDGHNTNKAALLLRSRICSRLVLFA
jgi:hypothetical protein